MELKEYFEANKGIGVLSTADSAGKVDAAIYARPHVMEDGKVAFIMADKLSYSNVGSNPYAAYLFKAEGEGYSGKRLYLKKTEETDDAELISSLRRKCSCNCNEENKEKKYLVYFEVEKELPLIGG